MHKTVRAYAVGSAGHAAVWQGNGPAAVAFAGGSWPVGRVDLDLSGLSQYRAHLAPWGCAARADFQSGVTWAQVRELAATPALDVVGEVLTAVIVARCNAARAAGGAGAEDVRERLGDGFVGGETVPAFADVVAEALGVPVLDGREQAEPAVVDGPHFRTIGGPAHIGRVGDDAPSRALAAADATRSCEIRWCARISRRMRLRPTR